MSITDELREWFEHAYSYGTGERMFEKIPRPWFGWKLDLEQMLDRIDAEHQKALDEWKAEHGQMWLKGYSECHAELLEGNETLASDLERCGWVRLPKDADGEYIHAGDVLDGYGKTIEVVELRHGRSGWVLISRDGNGYADTFAFTHHHAPTVEDVLTEFVSEFNRDDTELCDEEIIERFAAKLQLKEDA